MGPEYREMCKKAQEELLKEWNPSKGDCYLIFHTNSLDMGFWCEACIKELNQRPFFDFTWIPRQDQLQEILKKKTEILKKRLDELLDNFYLWSKNTRDKFTSMEQLWLAFVMEKKYNKIWDGINWIKKEKE